MRPLPPVPAQSWRPPTTIVDDHGKVVGARPGHPHNWGRWGIDDRRGTANLLTPARAAAAATLIRSGEAFSLAVPLGRGVPNAGTRIAPVHAFVAAGSDGVVGDLGPHEVASSDDLLMLPLQAGTHLDGLGHLAEGDALYNGFWSGGVTARSGARALGVEHWGGALVGRFVLLDAARYAGIDPFTGVVDVALIEDALAAQSVEPEPGDVLLVRTGWLDAWWCAAERGERVPRTRAAGLAPDVLYWLAEQDIAVVGVDNRTVEAVPDPAGGPHVLPLHRRGLRDLGLVLGELFDLDALAEACAADDRWTGLFTAGPLTVVGAVGAPVNPVALR